MTFSNTSIEWSGSPARNDNAAIVCCITATNGLHFYYYSWKIWYFHFKYMKKYVFNPQNHHHGFAALVSSSGHYCPIKLIYCRLLGSILHLRQQKYQWRNGGCLLSAKISCIKTHGVATNTHLLQKHEYRALPSRHIEAKIWVQSVYSYHISSWDFNIYQKSCFFIEDACWPNPPKRH